MRFSSNLKNFILSFIYQKCRLSSIWTVLGCLPFEEISEAVFIYIQLNNTFDNNLAQLPYFFDWGCFPLEEKNEVVWKTKRSSSSNLGNKWDRLPLIYLAKLLSTIWGPYFYCEEPPLAWAKSLICDKSIKRKNKPYSVVLQRSIK